MVERAVPAGLDAVLHASDLPAIKAFVVDDRDNKADLVKKTGIDIYYYKGYEGTIADHLIKNVQSSWAEEHDQGTWMVNHMRNIEVGEILPCTLECAFQNDFDTATMGAVLRLQAVIIDVQMDDAGNVVGKQVRVNRVSLPLNGQP